MKELNSILRPDQESRNNSAVVVTVDVVAVVVAVVVVAVAVVVIAVVFVVATDVGV